MLTKIKLLENIDQNRFFFTNLTKIDIFENFSQIELFEKKND